jgi:hypothetical protein
VRASDTTSACCASESSESASGHVRHARRRPDGNRSARARTALALQPSRMQLLHAHQPVRRARPPRMILRLGRQRNRTSTTDSGASNSHSAPACRLVRAASRPHLLHHLAQRSSARRLARIDAACRQHPLARARARHDQHMLARRVNTHAARATPHAVRVKRANDRRHSINLWTTCDGMGSLWTQRG